MLSDLRCKHDGCMDRATNGNLCSFHSMQNAQSASRALARKVGRGIIQGFSPEEISELTSIPLHIVHEEYEAFRKSIEPWLEASAEERIQRVADELKKGHDLRVNDLYIIYHSTDDPKAKIAALSQIQKEEDHFVKQMQSLGLLPKASEKLEVKAIQVDQILLDIEKAGRTYDIPVRNVISEDMRAKLRKAASTDGY